MKAEHRHTHSRGASVFGSPGERARWAGIVRVAWPMFAVMLATGYLVRAAVPVPLLSYTAVGVLFLILAVGLAHAVNTSTELLTAYTKGARGEERVARELAFLPQYFDIHHGLTPGNTRQGAGDYDHVVVGRHCIFVVETKNWEGQISVSDGVLLYDDTEPDRSPLEQVTQASEALSDELESHAHKTTVIPIVCFVSNRTTLGEQEVSGVTICSGEHLKDIIEDHDRRHVDSDPSGARQYLRDQPH